jgi:hypothetical protein
MTQRGRSWNETPFLLPFFVCIDSVMNHDEYMISLLFFLPPSLAVFFPYGHSRSWIYRLLWRWWVKWLKEEDHEVKYRSSSSFLVCIDNVMNQNEYIMALLFFLSKSLTFSCLVRRVPILSILNSWGFRNSDVNEYNT